MDENLLTKLAREYVQELKNAPDLYKAELLERKELMSFYQQYTDQRIIKMTDDDIYEYLSKLWAMLIWGNKHYVVNKIIQDNGLNNFTKHLTKLVWGQTKIETRWNDFRKKIKGMGPAMISEILCKTHPNDYMLWNRRAYVGLNYLGVSGLPRYDYQLTGDVYKYLCDVCRQIADVLKREGNTDNSLLGVDYFIWAKLQVEDSLTGIHAKDKKTPKKIDIPKPEEQEFIHNDIRDKIRDIGQWLGLTPSIERKISDGARVDTIWEATIGNMGRIIYVFEVQTGGDIKSLILNLLKSLNNPAVQGVVAVSDKEQLEKIKKYAADVKGLNDKLRYWEYEEVLKVHENLAISPLTISSMPVTWPPLPSGSLPSTTGPILK